MIRGETLTTGQAKADNMPQFVTNTVERGQLRVVSDIAKRSILIEENPHKHPFSWFLTHPSGKLFLSGRIESINQEIKLADLESGVYHFRTQGEVYEINVA